MEPQPTRYVHWINTDTGHVLTVPASVPIEQAPHGFYVPSYSGTLAEMKRLERKFEKKPYLIEKHIKIYAQ